MTRAVTLIAAVGRNGAIGLRDGLPWRLPSDLRRFKAVTMGKPLILGRKTFEGIARPLPGRFVVVVSRTPVLGRQDGVTMAATVDDALARADALAAAHDADEIMVGGGAEIYGAMLDRATRLRLTEVALAPEADAYFPAIEPSVWREVARVPPDRGPNDEADFVYVDYIRR